MTSRLALCRFFILIVYLTGLAAHAQGSLLDALKNQNRPGPPGVPAPAVSAAPLAPQLRAAMPRGPTLFDIRLGMPVDRAEALIAGTMRIGRRLETPELTGGDANALAPRLRGRLFMTADGSEQIAMFESRDSPGRVVGLWHKTMTAESWDKVLAGLVIRHGPVSTRSALVAFWGASSSSGVCQANENAVEWPVWRERDRAVPLDQAGPYRQPVPALPRPSSNQAEYQRCDALLKIAFVSAQQSGEPSSVVSQLFDMGVLAWLAALPPPKAAMVSSNQDTIAGPKGRDILGIRLGSAMNEAEALIRGHMQVGRMFEALPQSNAPDYLPLVSFLRGRIFVSEDQNDHIGIFEAPSYAPGRVIRVSRALYVTAGWDQALASLTAKYGPADEIDNNANIRKAIWGDRVRACHASLEESRGKPIWSHWRENGRAVAERGPDQRVVGSLETIEPPYLWQTKRTDYSVCGPTIQAEYGNAAMRAQATLLTVRLFDQRFMASLISRPKPSGAPASPIPNTRF
jgi:hypothetical protein